MIKKLEPYAKWLYLTTLLVLLAGAGLYFFILNPLAQEVQSLQLSVLQEQNELLQLAQNEDESEEEEIELSTELALKVPVTPSVQEIIRDVERMEEETRTVVQNVSFNVDAVSADTLEDIFSSSPEMLESLKELEELQPSAVTFTIELSGDYDSFLKFVKQLEALPRLNWTHHIYFEQEMADPADPSSLTATLTLSAFYLEQFADYTEAER